jgi:hypothetical protein
MSGVRVIVLVSSLSTDQIQMVNTRRLEDVIAGKKYAFERIDGALAENKEVRDTLFGISGHRGKYPQCFVADENDGYRFIGLWEDIEQLIDCDALPKEVLEGNPSIPTLTKALADVPKTG